MKPYEDNFYKHRHHKTEYAAERILSIVLDVIPKTESAVDLGCGVGTWLSVLRQKGIQDIQGIDGEWVNTDLLEIPDSNFMTGNFSEGIDIDRRFGLAISLEVAEHLPERKSSSFVETLTQLSDFVLFSAAIPYQGGTHHLNEQWPEYWDNLFREKGYVGFDIIRRNIWDDETIPFYYKQNILLFVQFIPKSIWRS
jgi:hypothetical protein